MRKTFLMSLCFIMASMTMSAQNATQKVKKAYMPFEVGEIKPTGWLNDWAQRAAHGMTKSMGEDFTEFVRGWADPTAGGWWHYEQTAYYLDGVTRLGYVLEDKTLMERSKKTMEAVMARQKSNGYILSDNKDYVRDWGTTHGDYGMYWAEGVFCRAALAYYSATKDNRALIMLRKVYQNFPMFDRKNEKFPLSGCEMDGMRKIVGVENMLELSRLTGDIYYADRALKVMANYADNGGFVDSWVRNKDFLRTSICHGVTYNEFSKLPAASYIWNGNQDYLTASVNSYDHLQSHYVLANGSISSNEFLHGNGAFEATESCDINDYMWSLIWMARATGDAQYGDRIEKDFFNAFPTAVNSSFSMCLYTSACNRIPEMHLKIRDDGQFYKEMHWPTCCPANLNRVMPNYIINMCMYNQENDLMMLTYGPAHLKTRDGRFDINMETEYPFRDKITFMVNKMPKGQKMLLRVPAWCDAPQLMVNGKAQKFTVANHFITLTKCKDGDKIELTLPMKPVLQQGTEVFADFKGKQPYWGIMEQPTAANTLSGYVDGGRYGVVNYGPLAFALPLQKNPGDGFELNEERRHEYRYALDAQSLDNAKVTLSEVKKNFRWSLNESPIKISVKANQIEWNPDYGDPKLPVTAPKVVKKGLDFELIPMGFAAYRLTVFPFVD
ncbi:MAG: glycoside hydrolase family 127 protein [Prevotellaceae bacterium]|nr:glycoside hydrolase family 127 protein [Candidatus Faecinaster equi]